MIYLDNAATSCPKPPEVVAAVSQALTDVCANPSRGVYELSLQASRSVFRTRQAVAGLFNIRDESRVVFTLNATHALNLAIKGILTARREERATPMHVVTSSIEHNSVARPLATLEQQGLRVTRVACASDGTTDPDDILAAVTDDTVLVVLSHASNVLGTLLPIAEVGNRLQERNVPLLVDAAQTAGVFSIDVEAMGISLLAVSGHKGLLGPQGVGALYIAPGLRMGTLVEGGTGSRSESLVQPDVCPDRFESGTPNSPGIAGLGAGIEVVTREGVRARGLRKHSLAQQLRSALIDMPGVHLYGPASTPETLAAYAGTNGSEPLLAPIVSLSMEGLGSAPVARILDKEFDIAVRAGLHCAPEAHRVAGTLKTGLVRLSVGHTTTATEIDRAVEALSAIAARSPEYWLTQWEERHVR